MTLNCMGPRQQCLRRRASKIHLRRVLEVPSLLSPTRANAGRDAPSRRMHLDRIGRELCIVQNPTRGKAHCRAHPCLFVNSFCCLPWSSLVWFPPRLNHESPSRRRRAAKDHALMFALNKLHPLTQARPLGILQLLREPWRFVEGKQNLFVGKSNVVMSMIWLPSRSAPPKSAPPPPARVSEVRYPAVLSPEPPRT